MHPIFIGQSILHHSKPGIITDIIQNEFVLVDFVDGTIESIHINDLEFPTEPTYDNIEIPHYDWDWSIPFIKGQRVALNKEHNLYDDYCNAVNDSFGTIITVPLNIINNWHLPSIIHKHVTVIWDNNESCNIPIGCLIPVGEILYVPVTTDFKIGMKIYLTDGSHTYGYITSVYPHTLEFVDDSYITTNSINKAFVELVDDTPRKIKRYYIKSIGRIYYVENTNSIDLIDDLIITKNNELLEVYNVE
jgi:hypothetical protein